MRNFNTKSFLKGSVISVTNCSECVKVQSKAKKPLDVKIFFDLLDDFVSTRQLKMFEQIIFKIAEM